MFVEYILYETDVPIIGMLSDACIIEIAVDDTADHVDKKQSVVPTMAETCSGGN